MLLHVAGLSIRQQTGFDMLLKDKKLLAQKNMRTAESLLTTDAKFTIPRLLQFTITYQDSGTLRIGPSRPLRGAAPAANIHLGTPLWVIRQSNKTWLGGRAKTMQNSQVKVETEPQPVHTTVQASSTTSRFNDVEYERWSEKIRNRNASKGK